MREMFRSTPVLQLLDYPILISRKMRMTEKSWNFHTVTSRQFFVYISEDDQESSDATIANLTVQIFTVPSVAQHLVQKHNSFKLLIEFFTSHFSENAKLNSDSEEENDLEDIDLTDWMHERQTDFTRLMHVIHDIEHILVSTQYTLVLGQAFNSSGSGGPDFWTFGLERVRVLGFLNSSGSGNSGFVRACFRAW